MKNVQFGLPDDLGWECNDEISEYIDIWAAELASTIMKADSFIIWPVSKAQLMDNIYAIIKKYQEKT